MGETQRFFDLIFYNNKYLNSISVPQFNFILSDCSISVLNRIKNTIVKTETNSKEINLHVYTHPKQTNRRALVLFSVLTKLLDDITVSLLSFTLV